jgi:hypothetical protein
MELLCKFLVDAGIEVILSSLLPRARKWLSNTMVSPQGVVERKWLSNTMVSLQGVVERKWLSNTMVSTYGVVERKWISNTMVSMYGVVESSLMIPVGHSVEGLLCEIEPNDRGIMR